MLYATETLYGFYQRADDYNRFSTNHPQYVMNEIKNDLKHLKKINVSDFTFQLKYHCVSREILRRTFFLISIITVYANNFVLIYKLLIGISSDFQVHLGANFECIDPKSTYSIKLTVVHTSILCRSFLKQIQSKK